MSKFAKTILVGLVSAAAGAAASACVVANSAGKEVDKNLQMSKKHLDLFLMMNQWVKVKQEGKNVSDYLEKNDYKSIAIYGMSYAGEALVRELSDSAIEVKYGIDKNAAGVYSELKLVTPEDELEEVDAVVVTAISFFEDIEKNLSNKLKADIIALDDILYNL